MRQGSPRAPAMAVAPVPSPHSTRQTTSSRMKSSIKLSVLAFAAMSLASCTPGQKGAVVGGAIGAGTGALIGDGTGALIGGAVGAVAGSAVAKNQAKKKYYGY